MAQKLDDDKKDDTLVADGVVFSEHKKILRDDFFRFTTRKRYKWDDDTFPTRDYDYDTSGHSAEVVLYIFVPIFIGLFIVALAYIIRKNSQSNNCCSCAYESESANLVTRVHTPPERRRDLIARMQRPPPTGNPYSDSRRELFGEPASRRQPAFRDLYNELNDPQVRDSVNGDVLNERNNFQEGYVYFPSAPPGTTEPDYAVGERPPDYATVTLNDLVNPTQPAFPVIRIDHETPPPEYRKDNPLFK